MLTRATFSQNPLLRFAIVSTSIYLLWFFGYEHYLALDGRLDTVLLQTIAANAVTVLRFFGYNAVISGPLLDTILLNNQPTVFIAPYCDGMVLYALFSGFVLAFPTSSRHKLWFIPAGVAMIYSLNVLRIVAMSLNHHYSYSTLDFNHHYTYAFIVYGFIGLLWFWWTAYLAGPVYKSSVHGAVA